MLKASGKDAGFVTSSVVSPRFGAIALAYVRGDFQTAGQEVEVVSDERTQIATVVPLPFSDS
jgi:aminomethyltransferase